jgi:hypothetical protein
LKTPDFSTAPFAVIDPPAAKGVVIVIKSPSTDPDIDVAPLQKAFEPPKVTLFPLSASAEQVLIANSRVDMRNVLMRMRNNRRFAQAMGIT